MRRLKFWWYSPGDMSAGLYSHSGSIIIEDHDTDYPWSTDDIEYWRGCVAEFFDTAVKSVLTDEEMVKKEEASNEQSLDDTEVS